jgi:hypothetical protein
MGAWRSLRPGEVVAAVQWLGQQRLPWTATELRTARCLVNLTHWPLCIFARRANFAASARCAGVRAAAARPCARRKNFRSAVLIASRFAGRRTLDRRLRHQRRSAGGNNIDQVRFGFASRVTANEHLDQRFRSSNHIDACNAALLSRSLVRRSLGEAGSRGRACPGLDPGLGWGLSQRAPCPWRAPPPAALRASTSPASGRGAPSKLACI